jgi:tetratricopeptide (TPR) repeat protein
MGLRLLRWLLLPMLCLCAGCGEQQELRAYRQGQAHLRAGNADAALRCFLLVTLRSPSRSAEAHLECGEIYLTDKADPLSAIYHYREYLRLSPKSRQTALVRQRIETAEKAFLAQIPLFRQLGRESQGDLLRTLKMQQDENSQLRRRLALLTAQLRQLEEKGGDTDIHLPAPTAPPAPAPIHIPDDYTVSKGDTLSSISTKIYGTPTRWKDIFNANRDQVPTPSKLKPGQQLRIPH